MSINHNSSKPVVLKALHWLNKQPDNWGEHIKDTNIAVKMYLKNQNKPKESPSPFAREIKQFVKEEKRPEPAGAFLIDRTSAAFFAKKPDDDSKKNKHSPWSPAKELVPSPPYENTKSIHDFSGSEREGIFLEKKPKECFKEKQTASPPAKKACASPSKSDRDKLFLEDSDLNTKRDFIEKQSSVLESDPRLKENKLPAFVLDEISLKSLKKTKKELNIEADQEALRLLIQLGRKSIEKLYCP